jgi:hypothetical protein
MKIIHQKTMKAMIVRQKVGHQEGQKTNWKPYKIWTPGRRQCAGYLLPAHELLQQVASDVEINGKEKNKGYNKFDTMVHQWKRDGSKITKGTKNHGEFFKHLDQYQYWEFL